MRPGSGVDSCASLCLTTTRSGYIFVGDVIETLHARDRAGCSPCQPTAIHGKHVSVNVVAGCGTKKNRGAGQIFGIAPASSRNALEYLTAAHRIVAESGGIVRCHVTGSDGVHVDAFGGPLIGERLGQLREASL